MIRTLLLLAAYRIGTTIERNRNARRTALAEMRKIKNYT